ncbi:MAG TPA: tetratricopeptide repeat protein [Acidobacteriaceae bacterium]|nr:tetratricopeptide repeat protein [Acidobacteriaceae bacterium]
MSAKIWRVVFTGVAVVAAGWQLLPQSRPGQPSSPAQTKSDYVDPAVCAGCHQEIARSYRLTGMGHSLYRATQANTIEDYQKKNTVHNQPSGLSYTMVERDGKYYQRRSQIGFRGQETNIVEEQVDYVIGSGNHARSYLHRGRDGRLIELPVTWYTENSGYWAMSPGYDRRDQEDFRRAIPGECMFCHNGFPIQGRYPDREISGLATFPKEIPEGIDCQRCHGPGGAHLRAVNSPKPSLDQIRKSIVNPARLSRDRQLEVCMQCHLETSSSLMPNQLRRYSRDLESFRPGEPLGDYQFYFDRAPAPAGHDGFEIAHAAYRLRMSACFRSSQMTCLTCHDPHQSYRTTSSEAHYVAVCESCHRSVVHKTALPAKADCLSCHMPKRRTDDVVHVVMTDHYIQRLKPNRDLLAPKPELFQNPEGHGEVVPYYPPQPAHTPENDLYIATAEVMHGSDQGLAHLLSAIQEYSPPKPGFYFELGDGYSKNGQNAEAIRWYSEALRKQPGFRPAIKQLAVALITQGQFARATALLRQAVASPPADDALFTDLGNAYLHQQMLGPAQQALQQALAINPEQPEAQNLLGLVAVRKHDPSAAESHFRSAIRSQPDFAEAHNNLGNLLAGTHNYAEAQYHFERAVDIDPKYAAARHSYGLMLELNHSYDQAVSELREAVQLDPGDAQTRDDLADILLARGQVEDAADQYRQAVRLKPDLADAHCSLGNLLGGQEKFDEAQKQLDLCVQLDPSRGDARLGLGFILARQGRTAEAIAQFQKALASPDPSVRNAAQNALQQLRR